MDDDPGDGALDDERALELSTVASIYAELVVHSDGIPFSASIDISVEPISPLLIRFPAANGALQGLPTPPTSVEAGAKPDDNLNKETKDRDAHSLSHLPPLNLQIVLPNDYPSGNPPIVNLESQYSWLPDAKLNELTQNASILWEDLGKDQVVFSYIDFLREAADNGFDLGQGDGEGLEVSADLKVKLLDFDLKAKRAKFESETFECGICLEPKKGTVCHRLVLCSHVFCVPCLQEFYNSSITEGDIINVKCVAPNCGKDSEEDRTLEPSELLQIPLDQDMVQRYIKMKRKKRLESDRNTVYCPRQWCQGPARCPNERPRQLKNEKTEGEGGTEEPAKFDSNTNEKLLPPPAERLAICEDCTFAFCKVCKASWHGEFFVCFPRSQFELTVEERASEDYMKLHTQPCPTCDARAQKILGCNHMICYQCNTHFCYLCGSYLDKGNPYEHYNTQKSGCYMRLWELEAGDDGEIGHGFAGGAEGYVSDDEDDMGMAAPEDLDPVPRREMPVIGVPQNAGAAAHENGGPGLQRFLQLVQNDEEDEWDSDEMSDDGNAVNLQLWD